MKRTAFVLVAATVFMPLTARASSASRYFGDWKIVKIAGYADISVGDDIAKKSLGQTAVISATSVTLPDDACKGTNVTLKTVQVDGLLREDWKATRDEIDVAPYKVGKTAKFFQSACAGGIVLDSNHLLFADAGVFYLVERDTAAAKH